MKQEGGDKGSFRVKLGDSCVRLRLLGICAGRF